MVPSAWIYSIQFGFSPPQLHQHLYPHSAYHVPYLRTISSNFFQKFQGSGLYSGATYVRTFPRNHALHTAPYGVPDQHLIMISSPTVLHNHWLSLQPCGHPSPAHHLSLSLSLSLSLWRPSTARTGRARQNSRPNSRAGHAALAPRWQ